MNVGLSATVIQRGKSGVAQYVFALLRALLPESRRHAFHVFVLEEDLPLFEFARDSVTLHPVAEAHRSAIRNILWHQNQLPAIARGLGLDILHVPSYRRMLWPQPCPLVATIHDLAPFHLKGKYDWKRTLYGRVVVRRLAWRQRAIIAVSEATAADLNQFFKLPPERIHLIWNGIDHERFRPADPAAAKATAASRWNLDRPFFLYVSRLEHPAKNHVRLIEAFNRFKAATRSPWLLAFAGADWHGAEVIHAAADASPAAADIRRIGFVEDAAVAGLYHAAEALVYPSLFEGFGFPPVEAMACGCPVISSTRGALGGVVGRAARLVNPEDVNDLAAALSEVSLSPERRAVLRQSGLANARRFDWNDNARRVLAVYERVLAPIRM